MTKPEFDQWLRDYATRFPDTGEWIKKQAQAKEMLSAWQEALSGTALDDALEINKQLTRGDIEHWPAYEREETPAKIRRLCWDMRRNRGEDQERHERVEPATPSKFPIGILFREMVAARERYTKFKDFDIEAEIKRLSDAFMLKYGAKKPTPNPKANAALAEYSTHEPAERPMF